MEINSVRPRFTVISPVYNEEQVVPLFFERLLQVVGKLSDRYRVDVLFLNNASTDGTFDAIAKLRNDHPFTYIVTLSANVGYQRSLECGLRHARGDLMVFIDVDCEDPPEMILRFIEYYEQGYDIVYGQRVDREEKTIVKALRKLFYHLIRRVADEDSILYMAEFALITSEVRDAIVSDRSTFPFIRSSIARVGFNRIGIPYKRQKRMPARKALVPDRRCKQGPLRRGRVLPIYVRQRTSGAVGSDHPLSKLEHSAYLPSEPREPVHKISNRRRGSPTERRND